MSEVKRYNVIADKYGDGTVEESESGSVVFYEDYAALKERFDFKQNLTEQIVELKAQRDALAAENVALKDGINRIAVAYTTEEPASFEIERARYIETPATEAYLNSVRAEAIPEGYVLVPERMHISADAMESLCFHCGDGGFLSGDFTDGILWVGDIESDDGTKTYGLNIATAEYPEEGSANVSEFSAQLRAGEPS